MTSAVPSYDYDYGYSDYGSDFAVVGIIVVLYYLLMLAYLVTNYVLQSLALYRIAKNRGLKNPGLAWVPVANAWTIGAIADHQSSLRGLFQKWRGTLLALSIISACGLVLYFVVAFGIVFSAFFGMATFAAALIPAVLVILVWAFVSVAYSFCTMICLYKIYEELVPQKAIKYIILSILVPLGAPICLLIASKSMIGVPVYQQPYYPPYTPDQNQNTPV